jgi:hypothetical protein
MWGGGRKVKQEEGGGGDGGRGTGGMGEVGRGEYRRKARGDVRNIIINGIRKTASRRSSLG